ncbi:molybdopterin-containing oxidoreductase family protein [Acetobacterium woodii]|uniref:Molybdopterin oxidoreductase n=1 Tax=Acetobacterium woodii (strain ATCC 29683 / DSM 1030 / JCM 2381 / KCTC 1655 / WB1) TaxID=931626 RepID=H6LJS1_ACEWD|nr:molybdopterin-dependent oxidoreductase [Acetobacterium woodii]AFA47472.1 molybdopterin oxidoreductase [Acetobacterium woodii DSM 1030]
MEENTVVTTCTRDCPNTCGLLAQVKDGKVIKLVGNKAHPINQGRSCIKCSHFIERVYHQERVLHPLKKINGQFEQISWEEALDEIAARMKTICREKSPEAILYYQGFGERSALKLINRRFFNLLGNTTITKGTICGGAGQGSQDLDFGNRISHDVRDYHNSQAMILWGRNPLATGVNLLPYMKDIKKKGGKVILIDPVNTETAPLCSMHVKPKPGTDSYLAMALSRLLHEAGAEDQEFLEKHCINYPEYKKLVYAHSVAEYAAMCDVKIEEIKEIADVLINQKPTALVLGWGLHRWEYAHTTMRAIDALGAVAGSIGVSGGGVSQGFEEYAPYDWSIWGDALQPPERRKFFMQLIGSELLAADPPIELAFVTAGNPVAMVPDANVTQKAFEKIPFLVVAGHFLDDTGIMADLFLPVTTFLEEKDIIASYGHDFIGPLNPAIPPVGECKSDFDIFMELGSRFDFADSYVKSVDQWLEIIMRPTLEKGGSLAEIFRLGINNPDAPEVPYRDKVFPTETGKFQLMTVFEQPAQWDRDYQFQLMSVAPREWICSEVTLESQTKLLEVKINTEKALALGLVDGKACVVENQFGRIRCIATFVPDQRPDLVVIYRGGWGQAGRNVNVLTRGLVTKVGNGTPYYETRVNVKKL